MTMTSVAGRLKASTKAPFRQIHNGIGRLLEEEPVFVLFVCFAKYRLLPKVTKLVHFSFV